ncbi:MAG: ADOP family duplicated permease [Blastocatellia bacterium]
MKSPWLRKQREAELDAEIRSHLDEAIRERIARGESPDEARHNALREFGNVGLVKEVTREMWGWASLERLGQDLRFGLRMLRKNPGFSLIAILTLALGIGANTAIFSVVNAVLLKPLPYRDAERLIVRLGMPWIPVAVFEEWSVSTQTCEAMAAYAPRDFNLAVTGEAEHVEGVEASADFFAVLQTGVAAGRTFTAEDSQHGRSVIISHSLWQRRFGASNVTGQALALDGESFTIIGVLPDGFRQFPLNLNRPDVWVPLKIAPQRADGSSNYVAAVARLKPSATLAQAQAEITSIVTRLKQQNPRAAQEPHWRITLGGLHEELVKSYRLALLALQIAVGLVLLIACVNVASLLLQRGVARQKETSIRAALGASRGRLLRQMFTESALLGGGGGVAGVLLAQWGLSALQSLIPADLARLAEIRLDGATLLFTLLIALLTSALFGLLPALAAAGADLNKLLKESGKSTLGSGRQHLLLKALVVSETALALALLIGAGLMGNSFARLLRVEPGFDPRNTLTLRVRLPEQKYQTMAQIEQFYTQALEKLAATPGVAFAGLTNNLPLNRANATRFVVAEGRTQTTAVDFGVVSADSLRAIGLPLVKGRHFAAADNRGAPGVVIVDESFASATWPREEALGQRLKLGALDSANPWLTVVGVARDTKSSGLAATAKRGIYIPYTQRADTLTERNMGRQMRLLARASVAPPQLVSAVQSAITAIDPQQAATDVQTMEQAIAASIAQPRFRTLLLGVFALLALLLAAAGIYGVTNFLVTQRTPEIGVRIALGARSGDVLRLVIGQGMKLALIGLLIGLGASWALTRLMQNLLFGISAADPLTFVLIALLLAVVALLACWIPARRATKVDPLTALRHE